MKEIEATKQNPSRRDELISLLKLRRENLFLRVKLSVLRCQNIYLHSQRRVLVLKRDWQRVRFWCWCVIHGFDGSDVLREISNDPSSATRLSEDSDSKKPLKPGSLEIDAE